MNSRTRLISPKSRPVAPGAVLRASALALVLTTSALAQGPSFRAVPGEAVQDSTATSISPNGRFVTGIHGIATVYRTDLLTGIWTPCSATSSLSADEVDPEVNDDGRVYGNDATGPARRVYRWTPETGEILRVPRSVHTADSDHMLRVSRDGRYAVGYRRDADEFIIRIWPMLYDFGTSPPSMLELERVPGHNQDDSGLSFAGVTDTVNGLRFIYGADSGVEATWLAGFVTPTPGETHRGYRDISPLGDIQLIDDGGLFRNPIVPVVRGDGPDWPLPAPDPNTPNFNSPRRMSADGRTVVGHAEVPDGTGSHFEAVVWRRGQPPATLRSILAGAGVALPAWLSASAEDISADGSTVVGTYDVSDAQSPFGNRAFVAVLPSLNDSCQTARPVTYGSVIDSTIGATRADFSGNCFDEGTAPDIWFSFTPATNETVAIDTCGSSFDTTLTLFQASSCASVSLPVACNDDANPACGGNALASRLSASVVGGLNYFIRVSGFNGAMGSVNLTITAPNRPSNDACAQAYSVPPGSGAFFSNVGAVTDARPNCSGTGTPFSDVWFQTVPTESGRMTYSTCSANFNAVMTAYDLAACPDPAAAAIACTQGGSSCGSGAGTRLTVPCTAGQGQLVRVGGFLGASGSGVYNAVFACDANTLSTYAALVNSASPMGYWRFDDSGVLSVADTVRADPFSCGNHPGTYLPGAVHAPDFQAGALVLDGSGPHVAIDTVPNLHFSDPATCPNVTLEAWVRTTDPYAGVILTNRNAPGEYSLTLVVGYNSIGIPNTAGRVMFISDGPGTFFGAISTARVDDGQWHHVVARRLPRGFGYQYETYIDGLYQGAGNLAGGVGSAHSGPTGQYLLIGNGTAWAPADAAFNGRIDEVALYCGLLSPSTIVNHFNTGRPPTCDPDINQDGNVDQEDVRTLVDIVGGGPNPGGFDPDFNHDGNADQDDVSALIDVVAGGACP